MAGTRSLLNRGRAYWFLVGLVSLGVGCAGTSRRADPIRASSSVTNPAGCGPDPIAVAKTFVAAIQADDQSAYLRCERPGLKLSAEMLQGLASSLFLLDAAAVTDQVNPPPSANEVVVRIPAPEEPSDTIADGTSVVQMAPHASGVIVRTARNSDGSYSVVDIVFYAST